jgi:hypothetical protein
MTIANLSASVQDRSASAGDLGRWILWLLWHCNRVPAFLMLAILEPVVTLVLSALALLGVLTAIFWEFAAPPHFPFFLVIGASLGFELALLIYPQIAASARRRIMELHYFHF